MNKADSYYLKNLTTIVHQGTLDKNPRPKYVDGTPAYTKFITQVFEEYDLSKNEFPIPTLRNTAIKTGINEIMWIYQKQNSSLQSARDMNVGWWDEWNIGDDTIGQRYGATVARYDLMNKLLKNLKEDPFSRRHIINLYQEADLAETKGLYPCAYETIWSVRDVNNILFLDMTLIQRSNDYIMAGYINKIQYVGLQMMIAAHLGYQIGKFCHYVHNLHIYDRHFDAAFEILNRKSLNIQSYISLKSKKSFYEYTIDDFQIHNIQGIKKLNSELEIAI